MINSGGQQYHDIWTDIKTNKFKSFYTVVMIVAIGIILLINFVLPSIISPIVESTDLSDTQKDWLTYAITGLIICYLGSCHHNGISECL